MKMLLPTLSGQGRDCRLRRSGSMRRKLANIKTRPITGEMKNERKVSGLQTFIKANSLPEIRRKTGLMGLHQLNLFLQMHSAFTIWKEMCGNGVWITIDLIITKAVRKVTP